MKKMLFIAFAFFSIQTAFAQEAPTEAEAPVFEMNDIDIQPDYPGGLEIFYNFFNKNFQKPNVPSLVGKIAFSFIIETDGTITNIKLLKDPGFGTGVEAERVIRLTPKWLPGKKGGKAVRVNYLLPIGIHTE